MTIFDLYTKVLQLTLLHPPPRLVEPDLRPRPQTLLQRTPDRHRPDRPAQLERQLRPIQTRGRELVRLRHEGLAEPSVIVRRNLPPDARVLAHLDQIRLRVSIDSDLALGAHNLRHVVLARGHHPASVEVGDAALPELDDADRVVHVAVLAQARLYGCDAHGRNGLDAAFGTEEPQRQVDVVDRAVDEDAAGEGGVGDEEARGI